LGQGGHFVERKRVNNRDRLKAYTHNSCETLFKLELSRFCDGYAVSYVFDAFDGFIRHIAAIGELWLRFNDHYLRMN
jgi:hypothetical protein